MLLQLVDETVTASDVITGNSRYGIQFPSAVGVFEAQILSQSDSVSPYTVCSTQVSVIMSEVLILSQSDSVELRRVVPIHSVASASCIQYQGVVRVSEALILSQLRSVVKIHTV